MELNKLKIIYIAGYGRSGSTALEIAISKRYGFQSLGELTSLYSELLYPFSKCGCGENYKKCELWSSIAMSECNFVEASQLMKIYQSIHPISFFLKLKYYFLYKRRANLSEFEFFLKKPFLEYLQYSNNSVVIDSSKSSWYASLRPLRLSNICPEIYILHIKRPLMGVIKSVKMGDNKFMMGDRVSPKKIPIPRAIISWVVANIVAYLLRFKFSYTFIDQRNLLKNPDLVFEELDKFFFELNKKERCCKQMHLVSGNRLKFKN